MFLHAGTTALRRDHSTSRDPVSSRQELTSAVNQLRSLAAYQNVTGGVNWLEQFTLHLCLSQADVACANFNERLCAGRKQKGMHQYSSESNSESLMNMFNTGLLSLMKSFLFVLYLLWTDKPRTSQKMKHQEGLEPQHCYGSPARPSAALHPDAT